MQLWGRAVAWVVVREVDRCRVESVPGVDRDRRLLGLLEPFRSVRALDGGFDGRIFGGFFGRGVPLRGIFGPRRLFGLGGFRGRRRLAEAWSLLRRSRRRGRRGSIDGGRSLEAAADQLDVRVFHDLGGEGSRLLRLGSGFGRGLLLPAVQVGHASGASRLRHGRGRAAT